MELVVRDGKFFTIGDKSAEFFHHKKNDIIFNAAQTASLFKYGGIKGANPRGKMLATGSAFAEGNAFGGSSGTGGGFWSTGNGGSGSDKKNNAATIEADKVTVVDKSGSSNNSSNKNTSTGKTYNKSSSDSKSKDSAEDFEETLDWIEIAIERIERAIDRLDTKANSVYRSWTERNEALTDQISEVGKEIELQEKAKAEYAKAAEDVGLDEAYAEKVRNGTLDIETITDEALKEKIDDYQQWYEKMLDCEDVILELQETEAELFAQRFENVQTKYENILQGFEHTQTMLEEYISQAEASGQIVSKNYYQALIDNEEAKISELQSEQADLIAARDAYVEEMKAKGMSEEEIYDSEQWYEFCADIDEVTESIEESNTAVIEFNNSIRDIDWEVFDKIQERISRVNEEADFFIELMSNEKLFDDNGNLTEQGAATMALHAQKANTHMYQADEYGAEIAELDKQIAENPLDNNLVTRRDELIDLQRESILAAEQEKEAIRDLVEEGINLELEALDEKIEKHKEELDSQKDLYEYQKKVKEQIEEIADLEKQMAAYSGDDSEEAKAKIQELKVSLEEAQADLEETEYDKYISDQQALLDSLYLEYENILNARLDNVDELLSQVVDGINATMGEAGVIDSALGENGAIAQAIAGAVGENGSIKSILNAEANNVGTTLSGTMNSIWSTGDGNIKSVLTTYDKNFQDKSTLLNNALNAIKTDVANMVDDVDKDAKKKVEAPKTQPATKADPTKNNTNDKKPANKIVGNKSSGDGKPKVGDKVKFVSGQYYYDSQGKSPIGSKHQGKEVYITKINDEKWATHPYHISTGNKLGNGDLGWLKLNQLSGYATGKKDFFNNEIAWTQENGKEFIVRPSDGAILTPVAKGDSILNANASRNIWDMANNPSEFIKDNLRLDNANIPSGTNVQNSCIQNFENINFNMPNIRNYEQLVSEMQKDPKFEKLILAMTVDQIAGKSKLTKNKAIR